MIRFFIATAFVFFLEYGYANAQKEIVVHGSLKCATDINFTNEAVFTINNTLVITKIGDGVWKSSYNGWDLYIKEENIQGYDSPEERFPNSARKIVVSNPIICYEDLSTLRTSILSSRTDSITIKRYDKEYWKTIIDGRVLYIPEDNIDVIRTENELIALKKDKEARILKRKLLIQKFGKKMGSFISDGYIKRGMTKAQTKLSWGEPNEIHRTVFSGGVHEQWVYGNRNYVYFENGILTAWQD